MFRDSHPASIEHISKHWELDCCFVSSSLVWTSQLHDSHFNVLQHPSAPCLNQRLSGESLFLKTSYTSNSLNAPWEEPGPFFEKNNEEAKAILFPSLRLQGSQTKDGNPGFNGDQHLCEVLMRLNSFSLMFEVKNINAFIWQLISFHIIVVLYVFSILIKGETFPANINMSLRYENVISECSRNVQKRV